MSFRSTGTAALRCTWACTNSASESGSRPKSGSCFEACGQVHRIRSTRAASSRTPSRTSIHRSSLPPFAVLRVLVIPILQKLGDVIVGPVILDFFVPRFLHLLGDSLHALIEIFLEFLGFPLNFRILGCHPGLSLLKPVRFRNHRLRRYGIIQKFRFPSWASRGPFPWALGSALKFFSFRFPLSYRGHVPFDHLRTGTVPIVYNPISFTLPFTDLPVEILGKEIVFPKIKLDLDIHRIPVAIRVFMGDLGSDLTDFGKPQDPLKPLFNLLGFNEALDIYGPLEANSIPLAVSQAPIDLKFPKTIVIFQVLFKHLGQPLGVVIIPSPLGIISKILDRSRFSFFGELIKGKKFNLKLSWHRPSRRLLSSWVLPSLPSCL